MMRRLLLALTAIALTPAAVQARTIRFTLAPEGHHWQVLAHNAPKLHLRKVKVNNHALLFGEQFSPLQAFMYGHGVALRFYQPDCAATVVRVFAVSVAATPRRVVISFVR